MENTAADQSPQSKHMLLKNLNSWIVYAIIMKATTARYFIFSAFATLNY